MWGLSYWIFPLFSALVWLAMLLTMFLYWISKGKRHYPSMGPSQHIAYISDVGAQDLKPLFVAMSSVTAVTFDLAFIFERWLRHKGRLAQNTSWLQKGLSICSIIAAIIGAAGLILLSIFDVLRHPKQHQGFLVVFVAGYVVSAIFICWEYQRLGIHFRQYRILRLSFWFKLAFILVEITLAIASGVTQNLSRRNTAAVLEWIIASIFTFYVLSFSVDFIPAVHSKHHQNRETEIEMATTESQQHIQPPLGSSGGRFYANDGAPYTNGAPHGGYANGANGHKHGHPNGHYGNGIVNGTTGIREDTYLPDGHSKPAVPASQNF